jgi:hypothetical protein
MAGRRGQSTVEFAVAWAAILVPLTFAVIYTAQLLWIWHSVNDFTRLGADYASTHCWTNSASNVVDYMRANVPAMVSREQFQNGPAEINVTYFARDAESGQLVPYQCDTDCSSSCIPDTVTVSVTGFQYNTFLSTLGIAPVSIPDFRTSLPMESAGCDPEQATCLP